VCRLFGFRSDAPARVHHSLVTEKNSLRAQSIEHQDGWGIAYYDAGELPEVAHGLGPAHSDPEFGRVSGLLSSHAVLAHVRRASVGRVHLDNAHPFLHGPWAFAHNGTITDFSLHRQALEAEIDPTLRSRLRGETDSERCFYIFMTRLRAVSPATRELDSVALASALAQTVRLVAQLTDRADLPSSMNFIATDGRLMAATRRHRTLFVSDRRRGYSQGAHRLADGAQLEQLVIASEELTGEGHWHPVPEEWVVATDGEMRFRRWALSALAPG
jgi:glutamine amidotransferase